MVSGISPENLRIECNVKGKQRQSSNTANFIFGVRHILSFISQIMTLMPSDVISTGTPAGGGRLRPGDKVEVCIEKIGRLVNYVVKK